MNIDVAALQELAQTESDGMPLAFCCWYTCLTNPLASLVIWTCRTCTNTY
ncbi:ALQxL family class IV lanthipeptide [Rhizohabitans arisaemae]|nr:ALQxL family class IV lanthipeptide [Rhizohabitans arisaemae]